ncbi:MAG: UDP-N-acetylmuramate dehydrogenase [Deltaproteobacteria bacterium]|nr:UDP-N-acetylmuramate dehydrogenase [Deltaproteobacteria bacterium]
MTRKELIDNLAAALGHFPLAIRDLSDRSTIGTGGPAVVATARNEADLINFIRHHAREGLVFAVLGWASNVLVPDRGLSVPVLTLGGDLISVSVRGTRLRAWGGATARAVLGAAATAGLSGLEMMAGIPGTVGGAAMGNAGSKNLGLANLVEELELITPAGEKAVLSKGELNPVYRSLNLPPELAGSVVSSVTLELTPSDEEQVRAEIRSVLGGRKGSQPVGRSLGSVFKNPPGIAAGKLMHLCGLRGKTIGGAAISEMHANFIMNVGGATSTDVTTLAAYAREAVFRHHEVTLVPEIKIWDETGLDVGLP